MEDVMDCFDGTAARQLVLIEDEPRRQPTVGAGRRRAVRMQLMRKDMYAELARRRRHAQMAARRELEGTT